VCVVTVTVQRAADLDTEYRAVVICEAVAVSLHQLHLSRYILY